MKLTDFGAVRTYLPRCPSRLRSRQLRAIAGVALTVLMLTPADSSRAAEHTLAGIRVFASVHDVLARYGNPNRIITDAAQFSATTTSSSSAGAAGGGMQQMGVPGLGGMRQGAAEFGGAGGQSGVPGMGAPANPYAAPGAPGQDSTASTTSSTSGEVMYVYNRPGGVTYDFLLSPDGRVIQITVLGYKSANVKTGRGIQLGTLYSVMIGRYGYPEGQSTGNGVLTATYLERQHASFQLRNNHVVGITVAAVE